MSDLIKSSLKGTGLLGPAKVVRNGLIKTLAPVREIVATLQCQASGLTGGHPIPPKSLRYTTCGGYDPRTFLKGGIQTAAEIKGVLDAAGIPIKNLNSILEFGCGCGRVIRNFSDIPNTRVFGCDYNHDLIDWCQKRLSFATFKSNGLAPPLDWAAESFDFIYSISVFTHLSVDLQHRWIDELYRVLKPGGYLLFTTHGKHSLKVLTAGEAEHFYRGECVVREADKSGQNVCATYHPPEFVRTQLKHDFDVKGFWEGGATRTGYQDFHLFQKPA